MANKTTARFMLIGSMIIFGTLGVFVRHIGISSGQLALCRAVMAAALIGSFLLVTRQTIPFRALGKSALLLLLSGGIMAFNWILLFEAYKYTTVSVATLSYYFAPVIVTVACPLIFKEKLGIKGWICFGMSTIGLALITGLGDLSTGSNHLVGIAFGLGAACLYATVIILNKLIRRIEGLQRCFLQFVAAIAVMIPYVLATGGFTLNLLDGTGWVCLVIVGVVHTGFAYCLYFPSLKYLPGQKTAILSYIDPLTAVILSVTVLEEDLSLMQILGGLLILGFTLWNELTPKKKC